MTIRRRKNLPVSLDEPTLAMTTGAGAGADYRLVLHAGDGIDVQRGAGVMDQAIEALPHTLRTVFLLRDIEGLSTLETAESPQFERDGG